MSLRFFSDHCVPTEMVLILRQKGHEVIMLRDVMPVRSSDAKVIAKAQELGCILLSLNGDFSDIVAYPPGDYGGIVAVQLHNHPEIIPELMKRFTSFLDAYTHLSDFLGRLILVEVHRIRIRS
jgi:predicted nuclease of predicted toxin-antitoxin system